MVRDGQVCFRYDQPGCPERPDMQGGCTCFVRYLKKQSSPENYNGATLPGRNGIVVKSHSRSTATGFYHANTEAMRCVESQVPTLITARVRQILEG